MLTEAIVKMDHEDTQQMKESRYFVKTDKLQAWEREWGFIDWDVIIKERIKDNPISAREILGFINIICLFAKYGLSPSALLDIISQTIKVEEVNG